MGPPVTLSEVAASDPSLQSSIRDASQENVRGMESLTEGRAAKGKTRAKGTGATLGQRLETGGPRLPPSVPQAHELIQKELFGSGKSSFFLRPN